MVAGEYADWTSALVGAIRLRDAMTAREVLESGPPAETALDSLGALAAGDQPGSELATELLIEVLDRSRVVHRFAGGALLDRSAVDDVVQDSLISIAADIGSYCGDAKITTWVHRIVRNRVVDHLRRQRATAPLPPDDVGPAERISSMIATRATIAEALAGLPDLYRIPVVLRDVDGLAYAEVSERLDRSLGTVKSQVARGRALIAAKLTGPGLTQLHPEGVDG
ncbi:MAG TPA: RNA polymerase sigma factor [Beutenbergiaceae bacterium]|nr:RNA polymerase sigma factor [Beutenbergiaceae bacterium]